VPHTSIASGNVEMRSIFSRIAVTAPVISSMVSPRTRIAISKPPICAGVASPDIMMVNAISAWARVSERPCAVSPMKPLRSVTVVEVMGGVAKGALIAARASRRGCSQRRAGN
jgi:hypothetical protein